MTKVESDPLNDFELTSSMLFLVDSSIAAAETSRALKDSIEFHRPLVNANGFARS